jgi:hypothetical protein
VTAGIGVSGTASGVNAHPGAVLVGRHGVTCVQVRPASTVREAPLLRNRAGRPVFNETRERERQHRIEEAGPRLRQMMPFLKPVQVPQPASTV